MKQYRIFWRRLFSGLIDGLFFIPIAFADYYIDVSNKYIFISWILSNTFLWLGYSIYCHGKYGQTIGKRLLGVKVLDYDEINYIGYRRAFLRESVWTFIEVIAIAYFIRIAWLKVVVDDDLRIQYEDLVSVITLGWLLIEIITMLFNAKRRALHDLIANSVVIKSGNKNT